MEAVPLLSAPLSSLLRTIVEGHESNQELAVKLAGEAVGSTETLSPSLLGLFQLLSSTASPTYVAVIPPPGVELLSTSTLAQIQASDVRAHEAAESKSASKDGLQAVDVSQWADAGVTAAQQLAGLPITNNLASAAAIVASCKTAFSEDLTSHYDRIDLHDSLSVAEHTGSSNATALLNLPLSSGSGKFHITFRIDELKGNATIGHSESALAVSFGVSPVMLCSGRPRDCASKQYMIDQKDRNCYDGSTDMGDFRVPAPFMSVGSSITLVVNANTEQFGFLCAMQQQPFLQ
jgi:hypothetical protein